MARSAFVVLVPEADGWVGDLRARHDPSAAEGVAAHVTLLFPFIAPGEITGEVLRLCTDVIGAEPAFRFALPKVGRFPSTAYLAPEPCRSFVRLTEALWRAFPAYPPFEGEFETVEPHLTVAHGDPAAAERVAAELERRLASRAAVASVCTSVALIENSTGSWRTMQRFALAHPIVA